MATCNITGQIFDSASTPLEGMLAITIDSVITNDTGDTIERYPHLYPVSSGAVDINLESSDPFNVTYRFIFYPLKDQSGDPVTAIFPDDFENNSLLDFHAVVPDLPTYDWDDIRFQTGITTTAMSTAVYVVAKEMLENPNLLPIINKALGIYRGSKPTDNIDDIVWIDPVTSTLFQYNQGLNKWYSDTKFFTLSMPSSNSTYPYEKVDLVPLTSNYTGIRITDITIRFTQTGALDGSNNYLISVGVIAPNTTTKTPKASLNTNNGSSSFRYEQKFSDNSDYTIAQLNKFYLDVVKSGLPGALTQADIIIEYKLIK